jgi:thiol-disulfide isomerase/thioredoxin
MVSQKVINNLSMQHKIIIVVFIASLLLFAISVSYQHMKKVEPFEEKKLPTIALFFAHWCGHCESYEKSGVFDKTFNLLNTDPKYAHLKDKIVFIKYDYDLNKDMANQLGIDSFPSIIAIDKHGEKMKSYHGDIYSSSKLLDFASSCIS